MPRPMTLCLCLMTAAASAEEPHDEDEHCHLSEDAGVRILHADAGDDAALPDMREFSVVAVRGRLEFIDDPGTLQMFRLTEAVLAD